MNSGRLSLQIGKDVLREPVDHVDERVDRGDSLVLSRPPAGNGSE